MVKVKVKLVDVYSQISTAVLITLSILHPAYWARLPTVAHGFPIITHGSTVQPGIHLYSWVERSNYKHNGITGIRNTRPSHYILMIQYTDKNKLLLLNQLKL